MANHSIEMSIRPLCEWIAAHPKCTRGDIVRGLNIQDAVSDSTAYRRLELAIERGFIKRTGNTSNASYEATDQLRIEILKRNLAVDHHKRTRVGYNEEMVDDYIPNETFYLSQQTREKLHSRCKPGSAPISKINDHDLSIFMCDLSYSSSRLEGNGYDYASTIQLAEHHIEKVGGSNTDKVMILNHRDSTRYIIDSIRDNVGSFGLRPIVVRGIHALLSQDLLKDASDSGKLRTGPVSIHKSAYIPLSIKDSIARNFEKMLEKAVQIEDPYEQSFFLLVHIPYLQPFVDCNKRTSRVICNIPLLMGGVTPISWMDVTNRPDEYTDAVVAVYEHNDTLMLEEIYVDCFMRSAERFSLLQKHKSPDPVAAKYRPEIKSCIRNIVLTDDDRIAPTVDEADHADFMLYIEGELDNLAKNDMLGIRYNLTPEIVGAWQSKRAALQSAMSSNDADNEDEEESASEEYERPRA
jgi:Fic/DOC family